MRLSICLAILATLLGSRDVSAQEDDSEIKFSAVRKVYAEASFNGPTDLARFQGEWFLAFSHQEEPQGINGRILIFRSRDGQTWQRAGSVDTPLDDVQPHLLAVEGELRLYFTQFRRSFDKPKSYEHDTARPMLSRTVDGYQWSQPAELWNEPQFFYRPRQHGQRFFVAGHNRGASSQDGETLLDTHVVSLFTSDDGVKWSAESVIFRGKGANETDLQFSSDGHLYAFVRTEVPNDKAHLHGKTVVARSRAPFQQWESRASDQIITAMTTFQSKGQIYVVGRNKWPDGFDGLAMFRFHDDRLELVRRLPTFGGQIGYPGVAMLDNARGLISFYSGHERLVSGARTAIFVQDFALREKPEKD